MEELSAKLQQLLPQMKMRLRASARRRLALDVMALSTGLRAVVMLDYVNYAPSTLQQLRQLLFLLSQEVREAAALRVLDMEGCGYLVHPSHLLEFMDHSLASPSSRLMFVVLDDDAPRKASPAEHGAIVKNLVALRRQLSSLLLAQKMHPCSVADDDAAAGPEARRATAVLAAGNITSGSAILLPTLNGWLLGYPVVYFFAESSASRAGRCVTSGPLHLYQVLISSALLKPVAASQSGAGSTHDEDELLSFTAPSVLSPSGASEDWARAYFEEMAAAVQRASDVWTSVRLEVTARRMESVALQSPCVHGDFRQHPTSVCSSRDSRRSRRRW